MLTWWYMNSILIMIIQKYVFLIQNDILLYLNHDSDSSHWVIIFFPLLFQGICVWKRVLQVYYKFWSSVMQHCHMIFAVTWSQSRDCKTSKIHALAYFLHVILYVLRIQQLDWFLHTVCPASLSIFTCWMLSCLISC